MRGEWLFLLPLGIPSKSRLGGGVGVGDAVETAHRFCHYPHVDELWPRLQIFPHLENYSGRCLVPEIGSTSSTSLDSGRWHPLIPSWASPLCFSPSDLTRPLPLNRRKFVLPLPLLARKIFTRKRFQNKKENLRIIPSVYLYYTFIVEILY